MYKVTCMIEFEYVPCYLYVIKPRFTITAFECILNESHVRIIRSTCY
jgi:hypothetical protein